MRKIDFNSHLVQKIVFKLVKTHHNYGVIDQFVYIIKHALLANLRKTNITILSLLSMSIHDNKGCHDKVLNVNSPKSRLKCDFIEVCDKQGLYCFLFVFLVLYCPCFSSIYEKANCIAIFWTGRRYSLGSCHFRGLWATCRPYKGGGHPVKCLVLHHLP